MATTHNEGVEILRAKLKERGLTASAASRIEKRLAESYPDQLSSSLDGALFAGIIDAALNVDATVNAKDHARVPSSREILDAACADHVKRMNLPSMPPMDRVGLHREIEALSDDDRLAMAEKLNVTAKADDTRAGSSKIEEPPPMKLNKLFSQMNPDEIEAEISKRWGAPGPRGRLASDTKRFRDALIAHENDPIKNHARCELGQISASGRELTPAERMTQFRAQQALQG